MARANGYKVSCGAFLLLAATALATPSITLSKKTGPPTSEILVSGSGFEPNVGVDIYFDTKDEALVVTNNEGEFSDAKIHAPSSSHPGEHWVTALERNNDKGAQQPFLVFTNWPQFGFDPGLRAFNPYENVLQRNNVANLDLAWVNTLTTYTGYFTNAAVYEGFVYVVYTGTNDGVDGTLYAFNAETGRTVWSYAGPMASPAVTDGIVYSNGGQYVYALDARTGKLLWTFVMTVYSGPNSPVTVVDGVVYVADAAGYLYALDAASGSLLWTSGAAHDADMGFDEGPAVANSIVYACAQSLSGGNCYALDETSGTLLWTSTGVSYGAPIVADGLVFVGDQGTYALNAATGAPVWSYVTSTSYGPLGFSNGKVYIAADGGVIALDAFNGTLLWRSSNLYIGSALGVANHILYVTAYSGIFALDEDTGTLLWTYPIGVGNHPGPAVANGWVFAPSFTASNEIITQLYAFRLKSGNVRSDSRRQSGPIFSTLHPDPMLQPSSWDN